MVPWTITYRLRWKPRPPAPAEAERPEVEAARRRVRGGELGHRGGHAEREHAHHRPADRVDHRPRQLEAVAVEQHGAGEDRDDRERDGEVGEAAHLAEELLRVAQPSEIPRVLLEELLARRHS